MSAMSTNFRRQSKEAGMVAIMVTLILIIVISLIVLGFAQISRRNQRQALDRQLSTQAFYAAESGVNDAAELIKNANQTGAAVAAKPDCASTGGGFYSTLAPTLDAASGVSYTCLMVDPDPVTLVYSSIGQRGTIVPLIPTGGSIAKITLTWQSKEDTATPVNNCPTTPATFGKTSTWTCGYGVLRFDLVPTDGALSLAGLQSGAMSTFVVPLRSGAGVATVPYTTGGGNNRLGVICTNTNCSMSITTPARAQFYMRVRSIYKDVSLQIEAFDASGNPLQLSGAQAVVDATGKAQDVLRRIQVRVPLAGSSTNLQSDYAAQSSEAICKRFSVMDGFFQSDANVAVPGVAGSTTNQLCQ